MRRDDQRQAVKNIPLEQLKPFKNHPFQVRDIESSSIYFLLGQEAAKATLSQQGAEKFSAPFFIFCATNGLSRGLQVRVTSRGP